MMWRMIVTWTIFAVLLLTSCDSYLVQMPQKTAPTPASSYRQIPVMYVVDKTKTASCTRSDPTNTQRFIAHMCSANIRIYDGVTVNISLNSPYAKWNADNGDVLHASVYTKQYQLVVLVAQNGNETDEMSWRQNVEFQYKESYSDIYITVKTGSCSGTISYGITLTFEESNTLPKIPMEGIHSSPYVVSKENKAFLESMQELHGFKIEALDQVFRLQFTEKTKTKHCKEYSLSYCFNSGSHIKYNITVAVVAADNVSGFGTYVCPYSIWKDSGRCQQSKAIADNSGAPFNLVETDITEEDKLGAVYVRVCGNGRFDEFNTFLMSSNGPRHEQVSLSSRRPA